MIQSQRAHLFIAAQSDPGLAGKNNEDCFAVSAFTISQYNPTPSLFAIVSDGIGGHRAGEVASEITVNMISQAVAESDGGHPLAVFQQSFYNVSETIVKKADEDASHKGMGATVACCWIIGQQLYIAYAGDSRIYLLRNQRVNQLTRDHTWIQEALEKGVLEKSGVKNHPNLHVIRRYLGSAEPPAPDLRLFMNPNESDSKARANQGMLLAPGDVLMLCTDGLTDLVQDWEILSSINGRTLKQASQILIDMANARGGHDNITIVMLGLPGWDAKQYNPGWLPG